GVARAGRPAADEHPPEARAAQAEERHAGLPGDGLGQPAPQLAKKFPPDGIVVESWYVMICLGHVAIFRVPPARLREFNRSIEAGAWKVFRSEIYATYDLKGGAK